MPQSGLAPERVTSRLGLGLVHKVCRDAQANRHLKGCFHKRGACEYVHTPQHWGRGMPPMRSTKWVTHALKFSC